MASNEPPRFLLLLPPAPSPPSHAALKAAFGDSISEVLKEVATHASDASKAAILEIALACPHLVGRGSVPRSELFTETQSLISAVYKLICTTAARDGVDVEDANGVDARILLVAWNVDQASERQTDTHRPAYGPIVSLDSLALSGRPWQYAFGVESEAGEAMFRAFVTAKGSGAEISTVQNDASIKADAIASSPDRTRLQSHDGASAARHFHVAVGGTFDHLHIGHKLLLTMFIFTLDKSGTDGERSATIGITGDQLLVNKKHVEFLESWADRQRAVASFVNALFDFAPPAAAGQRHVSVRDDPGPNGKSIDIHYPDGTVIKCTEIQDPFGPTITEEHISALIISAETRSGAKVLNDKREEQGWKALDVFEVHVLDAEEENGNVPAKEGFEDKLSSTAIREKLAKQNRSGL